MELRDYLTILWRRRVVVLLALLGAVALAATMVLLNPPGYRSTATLFFAPRDGAQSGTPLATQRLTSYVELVQGPRLAEAVVSRLDLPRDAGTTQDVGRRLSATAQPETLLLTVAATGRTPQDAQRLAQAAATELIELVGDLEPPTAGAGGGAIWLTVAESAQPGVPLTTGSLLQNVILASVLGLALGAAAAFLVDALDTRIVNTRSLREMTPGAVVGLTVPADPPDPGEGGSGHGVPAPTQAAVRLLRTSLLGQAGPDSVGGPRVVLVTGAVEGPHSRAIASWTATALSRSGSEVVLLRMDASAQGGAPEATAGRPGIAEVLAGHLHLDRLPLDAAEHGPWLLPLGQAPADPGEILTAPGMVGLIGELADRFDHVVIEAPPVQPYVETALLAGTAADQVVLVVEPGRVRRKEMGWITALLAQQGAHLALTVLARPARRGAFRRKAKPAPTIEVAGGGRLLAAGTPPVGAVVPTADAEVPAPAAHNGTGLAGAGARPALREPVGGSVAAPVGAAVTAFGAAPASANGWGRAPTATDDDLVFLDDDLFAEEAALLAADQDGGHDDTARDGVQEGADPQGRHEVDEDVADAEAPGNAAAADGATVDATQDEVDVAADADGDVADRADGDMADDEAVRVEAVDGAGHEPSDDAGDDAGDDEVVRGGATRGPDGPARTEAGG